MSLSRSFTIALVQLRHHGLYLACRLLQPGLERARVVEPAHQPIPYTRPLLVIPVIRKLRHDWSFDLVRGYLDWCENNVHSSMNRSLRIAFCPGAAFLLVALELLGDPLGRLGRGFHSVHHAGPDGALLQLVDSRYRGPRRSGHEVSQLCRMHTVLAEKVRGPGEGLRGELECDVSGNAHPQACAHHRFDQ